MTAEEKRLRALLAEAGETLGKITCQYTNEETGEKIDILNLYSRIVRTLERSEASKRGKSSRARGHMAEKLVCNWLKANGFPDAATTRSVLGSDGTRQPGDVTFAPGVVLSVKHVKTPAWPAWLRQVKEEAQQAGPAIPDTFSPRIPAVVHRTIGVTDVGEWPCAVPLGSWDGVMPSVVDARRWGNYAELLREWGLAGGDWIDHRYQTPGVAVMRFRTFAETVRLDK